LKGEYVAGKAMECMGKAIDSKGKVDAKKMKKCKTSVVNASHLSVKVPEAPAKVACGNPTLFPGSASYRSMFYKNLPTKVKVALPQPCLAWKGGCAAKSTFDGSVVHLKRNGKRCAADDSGVFRCDGTLPGEFKFVNQKANCSSAKLVAVKPGNVEESCHFAPAATTSKQRVYCNVKPGTLAKNEVVISSNQAAAGREGKVTLQFAPLSKVAMTLGAWSDVTPYKEKVSYQCSGGALAYFWSEHSNETSVQDRRFKHKCRTFPQGTGKMGSFAWPATKDKDIDFDKPLKKECPAGEVLTGHESEWKAKNKDRRFKFACAKPPAGMEIKQVGDWSKAWTAYDKKWELGCSAEDEVMVGVHSIHDNSHQDRKWKCKCAKLAVRAPQTITFDVEYARGL